MLLRSSATKLFGLASLAVLLAAAPARAGLPLLADSVPDKSMLPLPYGIGVTVYGQNQPYKLDRLKIDFQGFALPSTSSIRIENSLREQDAKFDFWLFPFMNVFGLVGSLDGDTSVDLSHANLPVALGSVDINYHGSVFGGGVTLAAGGKHWFGSLTTIYTDTSLSGDFQSTAKAFVITPKLGLTSDRGSAWIGATYQKTDEHHAGNITLPFIGPVGFAVELRQKNTWNGAVGMESALTKHFHLELEGGFGSRKSASVGLGYRF